MQKTSLCSYELDIWTTWHDNASCRFVRSHRPRKVSCLSYKLAGDSIRVHFLMPRLITSTYQHAPQQLAVEEWPAVPYSPRALLEHISMAQWDMLDFAQDPAHASPKPLRRPAPCSGPHHPARDPAGSRPRRLPHWRVCHPATGDGELGVRLVIVPGDFAPDEVAGEVALASSSAWRNQSKTICPWFSGGEHWAGGPSRQENRMGPAALFWRPRAACVSWGMVVYLKRRSRSSPSGVSHSGHDGPGCVGNPV